VNLAWSQRYHDIPTIWVLTFGSDEVARVNRLFEGQWCAEVARHMRDHRRHKRRIFETREEAMARAEEWTRANLERIRSQLPTMVPAGGYRRAEWPASNPAGQ
jgi:phage gp37-like protein